MACITAFAAAQVLTEGGLTEVPMDPVPFEHCPGARHPPSFDPDWTCPDTDGWIVADGAWDFDLDGVIERSELQCAIDCLNGDPDAETLPEQTTGGTYGIRGIRGGTLAFEANRTYVLDGPLRLPGGASGSVVLLGEGTTLSLAPGIVAGNGNSTFIRRVTPNGSNACDAELMSAHARNWVVKGFVFSAPTSSTDVVKGLDLQGMERLTVSDCRFVGPFTRAIDLHDCRGTSIRETEFDDAKQDVVLGADDGCLAHDGTPTSCWAVCASGPAVLWTEDPPAPPPSSPLGCNSSRLDGTIHRAASSGRTMTSVAVIDSDNVVLARASVVGNRPQHFLTKDGIPTRPTSLALKDLHANTHGMADIVTALIDVRSPGQVVIDGFVGEPRDLLNDLLVDDSGASGPTLVVVEDTPVLPPQYRFRRGATGMPAHAWSFIDVDPTQSPLASTRWLPPGPPIDASDSSALQKVLPLGAPVTPSDPSSIGRIWRESGRVLYCGLDMTPAGVVPTVPLVFDVY